MTIDYRVGNTRDLCAALPDGSVHLVATSPPFLALRSYLPADHEHKHAEIGSEPDPATFLDTLLGLTAEWGRVLAPWGSIAIELGDTYSGSRGENHLYEGSNPAAGFNGSANQGALPPPSERGGEWPRAKSLALIPQLYATSLAYGRNLLTGAPSPAGQWLVRNVVVWHRPNPAVGALGDKYRPSTSYIVVATRSPKRWFDLTAVRGEPSPNTHARTAAGVDARATTGKTAAKDGNFHTLDTLHSTAGAPPLDCWFDHDDHDTWTITTQPSRLAHYAMWPAKLAERLVLSMCPAEVCTVCGEPRRRVERAQRVVNGVIHGKTRVAPTRYDGGGSVATGSRNNFGTDLETLGWTDCGHDAFAPGMVLDPFAGTGTTLAVADLHGRHGIGFDIDARNAQLMDARRAEVARNLFGTTPEIPGQLDIFDSTA